MSLYTVEKQRERTLGGHVDDPFSAKGRLMVSYFTGKALNDGHTIEADARVKLRRLELQLKLLARRMRPYTVLTHDTDCDGTTYQAQRRLATSAEEAAKLVGEPYFVDKVMPEDDFITDIDLGGALDPPDFDYYMRSGYAWMGSRWNPWVEDDTIGTVLDTRYEDDLNW